jgi:ABC-type Zn uptake system ZnuABC Zn-binding protein ZnuA
MGANMLRRRIVVTIVLVVALAAAGCSRQQPAESGDGPLAAGRVLNVVATTTQVADFASKVGGDRVRVTSLFKPNVDAHDYEPSPADVEAIARADLVVENGAGLETWLHDTVASSGFRGPVVDTSQGVRLRHVGGETDPHTWQNPRNAQTDGGHHRTRPGHSGPGRRPHLPGQSGRLHHATAGPGR